ncbi:unnamed protein product [Scytosiphon promiscuus]
MISGDSTASHMGSVKNIEKARERRTFEVMPGSAATGIPDELQEHAQTIHPRMGYDMSDSLFMQQQEAAGRDKESKRALEERSALEAFRAAALQNPLKPSTATSTEAGLGSGGGSTSAGGDGRRKEPPPPPPPLAGIKLRKKSSRSGGLSSSSSAATAAASPGGGVSSPGVRGAVGEKEGKGPGVEAAGEKRKSIDASLNGGGEEGSDSGAKRRENGDGNSAKKSKKRKKGSKKSKSDKHGKGSKERRLSGELSGGGASEGKTGMDATPSAGLGLGLVAYSSGDDDDDEN